MAIDNVVIKVAPSQPSNSASPSTASTAAISASTACNTGSPIIQNGGFESGSISPWVGRGTVGQSYDNIVSPGSTNPGGGNYAFSVGLSTPTSPYGNGAVGHQLYQTLNTCVGTNYSLTADYRFVYGDSGCTFKFEGNVVTGGTANAAGWQRMTATFQASSNDFTILFEMTCKTPNSVQVDNVNVTST